MYNHDTKRSASSSWATFHHSPVLCLFLFVQSVSPSPGSEAFFSRLLHFQFFFCLLAFLLLATRCPQKLSPPHLHSPVHISHSHLTSFAVCVLITSFPLFCVLPVFVDLSLMGPHFFLWSAQTFTPSVYSSLDVCRDLSHHFKDI